MIGASEAEAAADTTEGALTLGKVLKGRTRVKRET
jgi:hypothetical protein